MPPGKADRWVTDFALDHYATEGKAKGQTWPSGTSAQVDKMIAAPQPGVDPKEVKLPYVTISEKGRTNAGVLTEYNTAGRENVSFGAGVSACGGRRRA